jgi:hypothetical protein
MFNHLPPVFFTDVGTNENSVDFNAQMFSVGQKGVFSEEETP